MLGTWAPEPARSCEILWSCRMPCSNVSQFVIFALTSLTQFLFSRISCFGAAPSPLASVAGNCGIWQFASNS